MEKREGVQEADKNGKNTETWLSKEKVEARRQLNLMTTKIIQENKVCLQNLNDDSPHKNRQVQFISVSFQLCDLLGTFN